MKPQCSFHTIDFFQFALMLVCLVKKHVQGVVKVRERELVVLLQEFKNKTLKVYETLLKFIEMFVGEVQWSYRA
jgi:hypothetical protein